MNTEISKKALIYCRTATTFQKDQLEHQEQRCRKYAEDNCQHVKEVFVDEAVSGNTAERVGLDDLLDKLVANADSEHPETYVVVVDDTKRLSRNFSDFSKLRLKTMELEGELCSVTQDLQHTPESNFIDAVNIAREQLEKELEGGLD